jgi:hypothetical protein
LEEAIRERLLVECSAGNSDDVTWRLKRNRNYSAHGFTIGREQKQIARIRNVPPSANVEEGRYNDLLMKFTHWPFENEHAREFAQYGFQKKLTDKPGSASCGWFH